MTFSEREEQRLRAMIGRVERLESLVHQAFSNDDHVQYLLANGGRKLSGDLDAGGKGIVNLDRIDIDQSEDGVGIDLYGYDDKSGSYFKLYLDSNGTLWGKASDTLILESEGSYVRLIAGANKDIFARLGDNAGAEKLIVEDSDGADVATIDSNGKGTFTDLSCTGNCFIETGGYTGDGTTDQTITLTDSSLVIKDLTIILGGADGGASNLFMTTADLVDDDADGLAIRFDSAGNLTLRDNKIISLGTGNFHVDDGGTDAHPNANGRSYYYIARGTH